MENQILWFIVITSLIIASDWTKLTNLLKPKFAPDLAIIAVGITAPHALQSMGLPIWLTTLPCYVAMMLSILVFPKRTAARD
jgi:hypothetical protein